MLEMKLYQDCIEYQSAAQSLYHSAFPKNEQIPFELLIDPGRKDSNLYLFFDQSIFVGLAVLVYQKDLAHLTYFAVEKALRGKGYGTMILSALHAFEKGRRILVDIERPEPSAKNLEERLKRKAFYLHAGYQETPVAYTWQKEDYEILSQGGTISTEEFNDFWSSVLHEKVSVSLQ